MKQLLDSSISSTVVVKDVSFTVESLAKILNIKRDGFDKYSHDGWPVSCC